MLVKLCGITNPNDAKWGIDYGADWIGLNFCPESPRKVSIDKASEILKTLPPFIKSVGVFANPETDQIQKVLKKVPLHMIQLHGRESREFVSEIKTKFNLPIIKAVHVQDENSLKEIEDWIGIADYILLDTFSPDQLGGTGEKFNWELALQAKAFGLPILLAGGLHPGNIRDAIRQVHPQGVDTASGIEKDGHPRKKDLEKIKMFVTTAKAEK